MRVKKIISKHNKKRAFTIMLSFVMMLSINVNNVFASTSDDMRELLGRQRLDNYKTFEELKRVYRNYIIAEQNNWAAEMFKQGKEINNISELEINNINIINNIELNRYELATTISSGKPIQEVIACKKELENSLLELNNLKDMSKYDISVEFRENEWVEKYKHAQNMTNNKEDRYDIGNIGGSLSFPISNYAKLYSPYGSRYSKNNSVEFHKGVDFVAPKGSEVLSQWNGEVYKVYSDNTGKTIIVKSGDSLYATYSNLAKLNVKKGDKVKQYDKIGISGDKEYIHMEVELDGLIANPLMLYGAKGYILYRDWMNENPGKVINSEDLSNILDSAKGTKTYVNGYYNILPEEKQEITNSDGNKAYFNDDYYIPNTPIIPVN